MQGTSIHWVKSQDCLEKAPAYKMQKGGPTKKMTAFLCNAGVVPVRMPCMQSSRCKLFSGATITSGDVVCLHNVDGGSPAFNAAQEHCFLKVPCGDVALVEKYLFLEISNKHPGVASLQEISCAVTYNAAKGRVTCLTPAFLQL